MKTLTSWPPLKLSWSCLKSISIFSEFSESYPRHVWYFRTRLWWSVDLSLAPWMYLFGSNPRQNWHHSTSLSISLPLSFFSWNLEVGLADMRAVWAYCLNCGWPTLKLRGNPLCHHKEAEKPDYRIRWLKWLAEKN